jgi:aminopeptidase N
MIWTRRASRALAVGWISAATVAAAAFAQRLPTDVVPRHYEIHLTPDVETGVVAGRQLIEVEVARPTGSITLHAVDLTLTAGARSEGGEAVRPAVVVVDAASETVELHFDPPLPPGAARLEIEFTGKIRDDLRGLYRIRSNDRWYMATQFEGTYARMMFPCFDEPSFKATFDLSVTIDQASMAISNGAVASDVPGPAGKHTVTFGRSPNMSTYLVALAVGQFGCLQGESGGVPIRVCARPEVKDLGRHALEAAQRFLAYYDGYYGIRYPFGKLDMIAFPDYEWGGMENTAAIFYKDRSLLLDPAAASVRARRRVGSLVAHEIAHQWFGDLVTMKWWDNVWLNEGFATWMAHKPLQAWEPSWDQELEAVRSAQMVLAADSLATTRPIRQNADTPAEIKELFDGVAYDKGAAVLRMVEAYVGEETFRRGVNAYLARFAHGNATAEDLWSSLATASGRPVEAILRSFVDQAGAPLVEIETRCRGGRTEVVATQRRFFLDSNALGADSPEIWTMPLCLRVVGARDPRGVAKRCELLRERRQSFRLSGCGDAVLANAGATGFHRTAYTRDGLAALAAVAPSLAPAEQIALLEDQWALVRVGRVDVGDYLRLAERLEGSRVLAVASLWIDRLQTIGDLVPESDQPAFRQRAIALLTPLSKDLGTSCMPGDTDDRRTLRAAVFEALGRAGDPATLTAARRWVDRAMSDGPAAEAVEPDLASAASPLAASQGDAALYERYLKAVAGAKTPEQSYQWLMALASFEDRALVSRSLDLVASGKLRNQDLPMFTARLLANPASRAATWGFLKAHWADLQSKVVSFGGGGAVPALGNFCDLESARDVEAFFAGHPAPAAERAVQHSLETIRQCAELKGRLREPLKAWLAEPATR